MKVLFVDSCIREPEISRTKKLCEIFLAKLQSAGSDIEIKRIDLNELALAPMERKDLKVRNELISNKEYEDDFFQYAREFADADFILIGAPFWNLSLPSMLYAYLEWVCMSGVTFQYVGSECEGLCRAKEMMLISTAGFRLGGKNNGADYLDQLSKEFLGIERFEYYCAEELDIKDSDMDGIMNRAYDCLEHMADEILSRLE